MRSVLITVLACWSVMAQADPAEPSDESTNRDGVRWPDQLTIHASASVGVVDWSNVTFRDSESPLQMYGAQMSLDRVDLVGVEGALMFSTPMFRFGGGVGYAVPRGGRTVSLPELGPGARLTQLHITRWYLEVGVGKRFGSISPFVLMHGAMTRAIADVSTPNLSFAGRRFNLGPRIGLRAHVYKKLFVQAAIFMDVLSFPDHTLTLGVGLGER